jgi:hypothetical protein
VKGNASGVNGTVVLRDNGADDLTLNASGAFMFATPIQSGHTYMVTVFQQPAALACSVSNANGTIANGDATNVAVMCAYRDQGIACGGSYCTAGTQECCDPEGGSTCQARSANCNQLSLSCDSAADCGGGDDCCASEDHGNVLSVSCQNGCGFKTSTLCDPMASNPCPSGGSCKPYSLLSGYYSCQ